MRVPEVVTVEEVKKWQDGDIITIKAGTGAGKSYFIKTILYAHAKYYQKKILFLIHRTNCVNQFKAEIEKDKKTDVIEIKTYQSLEAAYKNNHTFDFSPYQYIVSDEFHYFMSDAAFSKTTDMSLNAILSQSNKIRIFMSATGDYMKKYISNYKKLETIDHELPIKFDFIKQLTFFNKDETLEQFIKEAISKGDKGIFFIQSAEKAYELHKKFQETTLFNCSKNNGKYYKYVDQDKISNMLQDEKFQELILITTTCMDAGVNIIDEKVEHIVCDVEDIGTLIQCIGRKRLQHKDDKIHLYIKTITNQQLGGMETQRKRKMEMAKFLKNHNVKEYIEKYQRENDQSNIVYDDVVNGETDKGTKKINYLMYFKCLTDVAVIENMKQYGDFGYCKYLARKFGFYDADFDYRLIKEEYDKNIELVDYLNSIVGEKLFKEEQKNLIDNDKIDLRVNGRQQKTYKKLNEGLDMIKLPYVILPKKNNGVRYWIVEKFDK